MVEIALSPAAGRIGPAARRRGDPRHRRVSARASRRCNAPTTASTSRNSAARRSTRATRRCCSSNCPPPPRRRWRSTSRSVSCLTPTSSTSASPAASGSRRRRRSASASPTGPDTLPGLVLDQGRRCVVDDYRTEQRFDGAGDAISPRASAAAWPCLCPTAGGPSACWRSASRDRLPLRRRRTALPRVARNLLAASLQRAQSEEALKHAQRLESVGQLTGGIAHDFNNLLTVIQGNLQVLEDHPPLAADDPAPQLVAAAARASRRGAELTGKLLAFSRRQVLQPDAVMSLRCCTRWPTCFGARSTSASTSSRGAPGLPAGAGRPWAARLRAAEHRDQRARRDARRRRACVSRPALRHAARQRCRDASTAGRPRRRYVAIAIADSGSGMTEACRSRAFEPFFTTKEAGRGTGLG